MVAGAGDAVPEVRDTVASVIALPGKGRWVSIVGTHL